jgi:hypothetical protein
MKATEALTIARNLPLRLAAAEGLRLAGRLAKAYGGQARDHWRCTFEPVHPETPLTDLPPEIPASWLDPDAVREASRNALEHRFDLLGSGPVVVEHGMACAGFKGITYPVHPPPADPALALNPGNRVRARAVRALIGAGYRPIDWQLDFKSGFRWREGRGAGTIRIGHEPGIDVKVPWELARMQHLLPLAWGFILAASGEDGFEAPGTYAAEFRNQVLDFTAANPPRFGVNWACTMDVAIRSANLVLAFGLFRRHGCGFDGAFEGEFAATLKAHGRHIAANLEWRRGGNHYLADIAGLLFTAAALPRTPETDCWLAFCVRNLIIEVERQFGDDGATIEASTAYHRLSAEMAAYATALVLGLGHDRIKALAEYDHRHWPHSPALPPGPVESHPLAGAGSSPFPPSHFQRLERMADFTMHATKPNGRVVQIGDADDGRFFKPLPEDPLDHRGLVAAIGGLIGRRGLREFAGPRLDGALISGLAGGRGVEGSLKDGDAPPAEARCFVGADLGVPALSREFTVELPDPAVTAGLKTAAYPDFGLYMWRGPRLFLSIRCGPVPRGAHAHNDQLAVELNIDGEDWLADPGSYVYTADADLRNAYRSVRAHAAPRLGEDEPASLDQGLFRLRWDEPGCCLRFDVTGFLGVHGGFGRPLYRAIGIEEGRIVIRDGTDGPGGTVTKATAADGPSLRRLFALTLPFSPGYGRKEG